MLCHNDVARGWACVLVSHEHQLTLLSSVTLLIDFQTDTCHSKTLVCLIHNSLWCFWSCEVLDLKSSICDAVAISQNICRCCFKLADF